VRVRPFVAQVGEFKRSEGQVTRDYQREKRVLDGARDNAVDLGVEPDIAEQVMRLLIQTSLTSQEHARARAEGHGQKALAGLGWLRRKPTV
jgi:chorismate mutase/prephenate dehydrogenase